MKHIILLLLILVGVYSQKKVVVLVHGVNSSSFFWDSFQVQHFKGAANAEAIYTLDYNNTMFESGDLKSKDMNMDQCSTDLKNKFEQLVIGQTLPSGHTLNYSDHYIFVAHSLGGLVTRNLIRLYPNYKSTIKRIYTLTTPHAGAPSATTTNKEAMDILLPEMTNIAVGINPWKTYLADGVRLIFLNLSAGSYDSGSSRSIVESKISLTLKSELEQGKQIYKDLSPGSTAITRLKSFSDQGGDKGIEIHSYAALENFPVLWRLLGAGNDGGMDASGSNYLKVEPIPMVKDLLEKTAYREEDAVKQAQNRANDLKEEADSMWSWVNRDKYKAGYKSLVALPKTFEKLIKSYRYESRTGKRWVPCDNYYDDLERDGYYRQNIFGQIEGYGQCPGWYKYYTYTVQFDVPNDGAVPLPNQIHTKGTSSTWQYVNHSQIGDRWGYTTRYGENPHYFHLSASTFRKNSLPIQ